MYKIAFIGVGDMGSEMIHHLIKAGHDITIWDIDSQKLTPFLKSSVKIATSLKDAVTNAKIIITSVMARNVLDLHIGTPNNPGIVSFLSEGSIVIITSTIDPKSIETIHDAMPENSFLIDSPMIGGVRYAREASLVLIPAGEKNIVDQVTPILKLFGRVIYTGTLTSGAKLKFITNIVVMAAEAGIRESLDLADAYGINYDIVLELLKLGPMKAVVLRALDKTNPRSLRSSAEDFDELLNATADIIDLKMSEAGRNRLWQAVNDAESEPAFIDITTKVTVLPQYKKH